MYSYSILRFSNHESNFNLLGWTPLPLFVNYLSMHLDRPLSLYARVMYRVPRCSSSVLSFAPSWSLIERPCSLSRPRTANPPNSKFGVYIIYIYIYIPYTPPTWNLEIPFPGWERELSRFSGSSKGECRGVLYNRVVWRRSK